MQNQTQRQNGYTPAPIPDKLGIYHDISKDKSDDEHCDPSQLVRGYTLIEVAISLFVVSVVILVYAVAARSVTLNGNAKHQQIANRIAASELEDLKHTDFATLPGSGPFSHALLSSLPSGSGQLNISDAGTNLKQATVTVSWTERGSYVAHQVTLTTIIAKHGL